MVSIRDLFKRGTSKTIKASKVASSSINKGANKVIDFNLLKLKFIIHFFLAFPFFIWALFYLIYSNVQWSINPRFGSKIVIDSLLDFNLIFFVFLFYFIVVFLFFLNRAIKGNKLKISIKLVIYFLILNGIVSVASEATLFYLLDLDLNEFLDRIL